MTQTTFFKDTSIFQGIKQFKTPFGELRAQDQGDGEWHIFREHRDAFIFDCSILLQRSKKSCKAIYEKWLETN